MMRAGVRYLGIGVLMAMVAGGAFVASGIDKETYNRDAFDSRVIVTSFGKTSRGEETHLYRIMGRGGLIADFSDYGARIVRLYVPDKHGNLADVVTGFNDVSDYEMKHLWAGTTIGRFGNRLANGRFTLNGETYQVPVNEEKNGFLNCLHGGTNSFSKVVWKAVPIRRPGVSGVRFIYVSPDGDEGFPGKLTVSVTHLISAQNIWTIEYAASVEGKPTPINLTNHVYFNLKGEGQGDALDQILSINASRITPINAGLIPDGTYRDVTGTPFDFRTPHAVGALLGMSDDQLKITKVYDHNWVLDKKDPFDLAATLWDKASGRYLEIRTTEPGMQFYSGGPATPLPGKTVGSLPKAASLALETQHFPDSPNHQNFPNTILKPGEQFRSRTEFAFSVKREEGQK